MKTGIYSCAECALSRGYTLNLRSHLKRKHLNENMQLEILSTSVYKHLRSCRNLTSNYLVLSICNFRLYVINCRIQAAAFYYRWKEQAKINFTLSARTHVVCIAGLTL